MAKISLKTTIIFGPQNISGHCNMLNMSVPDEGHVVHTKLDIYVFTRKILLPLVAFEKKGIAVMMYQDGLRCN